MVQGMSIYGDGGETSGGAAVGTSDPVVRRVLDEMRQMAGERERLKIVLSVLLRRGDGHTVITAEEMAEFSPETVLYSSNQPDGGLRLWVTP